MMQFSIFTIGYGNRGIEEFIEILKKYEIKVLIDIRSIPYSRFRPSFNTNVLQQYLLNESISYRFMGKELGGKPDDENLYQNKNPDYDKMRETLNYQKGISYLEAGMEFNYKMAIMCAELDFRNCHRNKLVGIDLQKKGYDVLHIEKDGSLYQAEKELF